MAFTPQSPSLDDLGNKKKNIVNYSSCVTDENSFSIETICLMSCQPCSLSAHSPRSPVLVGTPHPAPGTFVQRARAEATRVITTSAFQGQFPTAEKLLPPAPSRFRTGMVPC